MKSSLSILVFTIAFFHQISAQTISTIITFEEKMYDFYKVFEKNGKVSHTFIFKNNGKIPIAIDGVSSGCGCTTANYTKTPLQPGSKGEITVTFNPFYRPGFFSKEIVIFSNNRKNISRIWIKGTVVPFTHPVGEDYPYSFGHGLHLNLKVLAFGEMKLGMTKQLKLRYANDTNKPMTLYFMVNGNHRSIKFSNPGKLAPMQRGEMIISFTQVKKLSGKTEIDIYPVVNGTRLSQSLQAKITSVN